MGVGCNDELRDLIEHGFRFAGVLTASTSDEVYRPVILMRRTDNPDDVFEVRCGYTHGYRQEVVADLCATGCAALARTLPLYRAKLQWQAKRQDEERARAALRDEVRVSTMSVHELAQVTGLSRQTITAWRKDTDEAEQKENDDVEA